MKHEFHAEFPLALKDSVPQGFAIAWLVKQSTSLPDSWPEIARLKDDWARLEILSQAIITDRKDEARIGTGKMSGGLRYWIEHHAEKFFQRQSRYLTELKLYPTLPDPSIFPTGSWAAKITFTLRKPYISKDDTDLYILDNPVKKEWVFKVPYIAPSQWKGALRAAMMRQLVAQWQQQNNQNPEEFARRRLQLALLFGDEKGEDPGSVKGLAKYLDEVGGQEAASLFRRKVKEHFKIPEDKPIPHFSGRLHFYPTFFNRIGLEVINPHDRKTGAGKNPIYFECVPAGTQGIFTLLYVPLDLSDDPQKAQQDAKEDLQVIAEGIRAMLTNYGFGAKTSSGYGVAEVREGQIEVRPQQWKEAFVVGWKEK